MSLAETDPVAFWAGMIVQEGKPAALEIAERAGVEAALDAVNYIAEERQKQMVRYRERLDELLTAVVGYMHHPDMLSKTLLAGAAKSAREALDG